MSNKKFSHLFYFKVNFAISQLNRIFNLLEIFLKYFKVFNNFFKLIYLQPVHFLIIRIYIIIRVIMTSDDGFESDRFESDDLAIYGDEYNRETSDDTDFLYNIPDDNDMESITTGSTDLITNIGCIHKFNWIGLSRYPN